MGKDRHEAKRRGRHYGKAGVLHTNNIDSVAFDYNVQALLANGQTIGDRESNSNFDGAEAD